MAVYKEVNIKESRIVIWKYEDKDREEIFSLANELDNIEKYHQKRQTEKLIVRKILKMILPHHQLMYHQDGAPYLMPSGYYISISHSLPFIVVAISPNKIGVDIEKIKPKIKAIKNKFLNASELLWTDNEREEEYLTAIWTIKEALYKIDSSKNWSFSECYEVFPFDLSMTENISCRVQEQKYNAQLQRIEDYYLSIIIKE